MAYIDWNIRGPAVVTCNCDWGCPCQFNGRPSHGDCTAALGMQIEQGHFGDVKLDGLRWVALVSWPGAIHEGHGQCLPVVDERADEAQRNAILTILSGQETEPGATVFNVFASTYETVHEPRFAPIEFSANVKERTAHFEVPNLVEASGEPIHNPVSGEPHRVRVSIPEGFEYHQAEYGNSSARATDPMPMAWAQGHGHFFEMQMTPHGPVD
jgi:hypothetical protein